MPSLSEETGGRVSMLMPGSTIGIIGGGQLGRMMALSARYMGFRVGVLDPTPNCPTGQVADFQITAEYDDKTAIHDLAVQSDVLTYEFENVDADAIDEVRGITATPQAPICCASPSTVCTRSSSLTITAPPPHRGAPSTTSMSLTPHWMRFITRPC